MRILIHAANLSAGGGLVIGQKVIRAWLAKKEVSIFVLASPPIAAFLEKEGVAANSWLCIPQSPGRSLRAGRDFRKIARQAEADFRPDVVFTVFGPPLWRPRAPHLCGFANGLYFPQNPVLPFGSSTALGQTLLHRMRRWLVFRSMKKDTDAIWVETESARGKLRSFIGRRKLYVISNELSDAFKNVIFPKVQISQTGLFHVLMVAAGYPHKNFSLLQALLKFPEIAAHFTFQTTLPEADFNRYFPETANVRNLGPLSPEALVAAYSAADFIFCPSRAEIFSATWLEAMAARRPLICADIAAARALCGDAALYFKDNDPKAASNALQQLATNPELQRQLIQNGIAKLKEWSSPTSRADRLYQLLRRMTAEKSFL